MQIQARNFVADGTDGWGTRSAILRQTTTDGYPSVPTDPRWASRSETCVTVVWGPPLVANGIIVAYTVSRKTEN